MGQKRKFFKDIRTLADELDADERMIDLRNRLADDDWLDDMVLAAFELVLMFLFVIACVVGVFTIVAMIGG